MSRMNIEIRRASPDDVGDCARILFDAFAEIADRHRFPRDFPSTEMALQVTASLVSDLGTFGVVAVSGGRVVGSNFLAEHDAIRAVGPITVAPSVQAKGVGRLLMEAVVERGRDAVGIRLLQDAFNAASLSLYTSLGFDVKEPVVIVEGVLEAEPDPDVEVRPLEPEDLDACAALAGYVTGFERVNELRALPPAATPFVAARDGYVVAYAAWPTFWALNHAMARTVDDMRALLAGAARATGLPLWIIVPTRQADLFRWCLASGLRVVKPMNLMAMGAYREPTGAYLPSVGY
jgi:GNAT superfamily N-acetyltransferase